MPAPAGAMLILLPLFLSCLNDDGAHLPNEVIFVWMATVGLLMISRIPTYSFKFMTVSRDNVKYFLLAFACVVAALLNYLWLTLSIVAVAYFISVLWAWLSSWRRAAE